MVRLLVVCALAPLASAYSLGAPSARARIDMPRTAHALCLAKAKLFDSAGAEIKPALGAYMHFCAERRPGLTTELKTSKGSEFKQPMVMTALGAEWKALGDAGQQRFKGIADDDKVRFDAAFASNPENALVAKSSRKKAAAGDKPKRALSAYMHFCNERRPTLTAELKASMGAAFKNPAVMVALGVEWKALDGASKGRFEAMVAAEKAALAAA